MEAAFIGSFALARVNKVARNVSQKPANVVMMAKSKAIPFLDVPKKLEDAKIVGNAGFDPLGLTDVLDLKYVQASEIKHGRICMLATLGWIVQEVVHLPGDVFSEKHAIAAIYKVPYAGWVQIIAFICLCELVTFKANYDETSAPGAYGFDPMGLGKSDYEKLRLNEIKNGRLAMIGFAGFLMQYLVTGQGVIEQLTSFKSLL
eukprot:CAMPEP_0184692100 /NCGR_PEP_ID=MMETSP0313-20130426/718_1 /TAXON_ID=2792 /ORGANISM="Porphyridium aerugineum, Strain SAG 1380-2" /LENGTH=202 /DNA_ID=CAMNT_0027149907 /DNA_START=146 /DNA_END=754 /DNA_ORIENTATION=-